jgi:hypothetical protein
MREFAERAGMPDQFTQNAVVAVPPRLNRVTLSKAVEALMAHHDMLRARLTRGGDDPASWSLTVPAGSPAGPGIRVNRVFAVGLGQRELDEAVARETRVAAGRLNARTGTMLQAVWLDLGPGEEGRLLIVAHHLAIDALSWQTLIPDLEAAYTALAQGRPAELPPVPTPFGQWAQALAARAADWETELPAWQRILAPGEPPLTGRALDPGRDTAASAHHATATLPPQATTTLLTHASAALAAAPGDLTLAALAAAVTAWRAAPGPVLIDVESHGRDALAADRDLDRTIGWFTSVHPVRLDPGPDP